MDQIIPSLESSQINDTTSQEAPTSSTMQLPDSTTTSNSNSESSEKSTISPMLLTLSDGRSVMKTATDPMLSTTGSAWDTNSTNHLNTSRTSDHISFANFDFLELTSPSSTLAQNVQPTLTSAFGILVPHITPSIAQTINAITAYSERRVTLRVAALIKTFLPDLDTLFQLPPPSLMSTFGWKTPLPLPLRMRTYREDNPLPISRFPSILPVMRNLIFRQSIQQLLWLVDRILQYQAREYLIQGKTNMLTPFRTDLRSIGPRTIEPLIGPRAHWMIESEGDHIYLLIPTQRLFLFRVLDLPFYAFHPTSIFTVQ